MFSKERLLVVDLEELAEYCISSQLFHQCVVNRRCKNEALCNPLIDIVHVFLQELLDCSGLISVEKGLTVGVCVLVVLRAGLRMAY